ncbi:hypothetical protein [Arthrobacter sp. 260]|uniref:hypothetical protein n=1 Tax=Arthrobacter sp. 260 TaxID=2735314 RepID=UPI0014928E41|nr:hypothetical protein [Arthrobacter sp. 260]NOJ59943.1 hypothetical protein [Arthrobacter sp. 260]
MKQHEMAAEAGSRLMATAEWEPDFPSKPSDPEAPESGLPEDLSELSVSELATLCDRVFSELDQEFPTFGAHEDYRLLTEELQSRGEHRSAEGRLTHDVVEGADDDEQS